MDTKRCVKCDTEKSVAFFAAHPTTKDRKHSWCRQCRTQDAADKRWRTRKTSPIPKATHRPTQNDLHWAAGFIDGEGCFTLAGSGISPRISVSQTKETWALDKLQAMFGGSIRANAKPENEKWSQAWTWGVSGERALGVMQTLFVLMSPRRQARIKEVIAEAKKHLGKWRKAS